MLDISMDLDSVLYPFAGPLRSWFIEGLGYNESQIVPATTWEMWEPWGITEPRFWSGLAAGVRAKAIMWEGEPEPHAKEMLAQLISKGHRIHIVTARDIPGAVLEARSATYYWLQKYLDLPWSSIIISSNKTILPSQLLFDDAIINLDMAKQAGILPVCYNQPWNQDWTGLRVHDFLDVYDLVVQLTEELKRDYPDPRSVHTANTLDKEPTTAGTELK